MNVLYFASGTLISSGIFLTYAQGQGWPLMILAGILSGCFAALWEYEKCRK